MSEEDYSIEEDLEETKKCLKEANKEIERLKELCNKYEEEHKTVFEEWKKTINIINELEHDFESYELEYLQDTYQGSLANFIETELERIQELKGVDKE